MRLLLSLSNLLLVLVLLGFQNSIAESPVPVPMKAELSPSQARAALNYEPTKGPLESFFPECAVDKQKASSLTNASGQGVFSYDRGTKELSFDIKYSGLSGPPIMAHFHHGAPGVSGPILQTICGDPPPTSPIGYSPDALLSECLKGTSGEMKGGFTLQDYVCPEDDKSCTSLTVEQQEQMLSCGNIYVNFHTCLNQPGEISGQLIPLKWLGKELDCNALPPKGK